MGSNRQPKDRQKALTSHLERCYTYLAEARSLYQADALKVHVSTSRDGKIRGIASISVSPSFDCLMRWVEQKEGIICGHCYAIGALMTYRQTIVKRLIQNAVLMEQSPLGREYAIPGGMIGPVRFNAFGEVLGKDHVAWIMAICRANPKATFSLITKRVGLFPMQRRPRNLILIASKYQIGDLTLDPRADKTYCIQENAETEEQMRDEDNTPCHNECIQCYLFEEGCYTKKGPKRIVRQLQKV